MSWVKGGGSGIAAKSPPPSSASASSSKNDIFAGVDPDTRKQFKFSSGTSEEEIKLQVTKFKQNIETLYAAGYHRAQITALSLFDRVIGGLCWSISNAGISVDVDILFQENMKTGQKVSLSEAVVSACREMKCPFPLQANQVSQCNDFGALLPIIKWLCEKVLQWREITGDRNRIYSEMVFESEGFLLPQEAIERERAFLDCVSDTYVPERKHRMLQSRWSGLAREEVEDARVQACLLEYGFRYQRRTGSDDSGSTAGSKKGERLAGFEKEFARMQRIAEAEEEERAKVFEEREKKLMAKMMQIEGTDSKKGASVDVGSLVGIVGLEADNIRDAAAQRDEVLSEIQAAKGSKDGPMSKAALDAQYKRRKEAAKRQVAEAQKKLDAAKSVAEDALNRMQAAQAKVKEREKYNERVVSETKKVEEAEKKSEFQEFIKKLKGLVALNEALKKQERAFKETCGRTKKAMEAEIHALKNRDPENKSEEEKRLDQIEEMYNEIDRKYGKVRSILARKSQANSAVVRQIDDVPTRTELIQYERRFEELYQEIESTLEETRKYYDKYNVQARIKNYLQKEVELLEGINEKFLPSMETKAAQEEFLSEIKRIDTGLASMSGNLDKKRETAAAENEVVSSKYQSLVDEQRAYFKAVKDFQTECDKNERLSEQLGEV